MGAVDRVEEWRQVTEHYRSLTDDELVAIARQRSELTDVAQQAMDAEILHRKLEIPPELPDDEPKVPVLPEPEPDSPYEPERQLAEIETVYSLRDALQLQRLLEADGIPCYLGDEEATDANAVRSNFANGVSVKIMRIGIPYATRARRMFQPQDDSRTKERDEDVEADPLLCPKCKSDQVFLDEAEPDPANPEKAATFQWTCDACGHRWEDDGILTAE